MVERKRLVKPLTLASFMFFIIYFLNSCKNEKIIKEEFLLPQGFSGYAIIIYNQEVGIPDSVVGRKVVYKFPNDGILIVKGEQHQVNTLNNKYYYYNENSTTLKEICNYHNLTKNCISKVYNRFSGQIQEFADSENFIYTYSIIGRDSVNNEFDPRTLPKLVAERKMLNNRNF